jgi:predicted alternative tryptophan synthase beta-subunit
MTHLANYKNQIFFLFFLPFFLSFFFQQTTGILFLYLTMTPPRTEALVETDTSEPNPHLHSNIQPDNVAFQQADHTPDYLRMILTARVYDVVQETPLQEAVNINAKLKKTGVHQNHRVYLKREDLQPVFSFKIRGAYNKLAHLTEEEKKAGVIACSAGKGDETGQ